MHRRVLFLISVLGAACSASGTRDVQRGGGRLVLTTTAPVQRTLFDLPAVARYCERDSTLSVVAVGDRWTGALAVRTPWPLPEETRFTVAVTLGAAGSGAVAARPIADSARAALVGSAGTITVVPGATLGGRIDAEVPGDSAAATRLVGRFDSLTVRTGACP